MKTDKRILTKHPQGKAGVNIEKKKYDQMKSAITKVMATRKEITFEELAEAVVRHFGTQFQGSVLWYFTTVKLDLEARGILKRIPGSKPQKLKLGKR